jgi:hypothetical protein
MIPNTPQEIFDYVIQRLLEQGKRSMTGEEGCKYRGDGGTRCALGWLIPDDRYHAEMDDLVLAWNVQDLLRHDIPAITALGHELAYEIQRAHDQASDHIPGLFKTTLLENMKDVALRRNLAWNF